MKFTDWIDEVNGQVKERMHGGVRTQELSWDSAVWVAPAGTVVASLDDDETTAWLHFDGAPKQRIAFNDVTPYDASTTITERLAGRR